MRRLLIAGAGILVSLGPAVAQDRLNGFYLTSPVELSQGYDSGFVFDARAYSDYVTLLTGPSFAWLRTTHRTDFSIDYQPEFEWFARYGNLDSWNHSSTMRLTHRINGRWTLIAGNSLIVSSDPTRALGNSLVLLPRGRYVQDSIYLGAGYKIDTNTKLTFRYDGAVNTMQLPAPMTGELDHAANAVSATLDRSLTSTQTLSGTYSFLHFTPFNPQISGQPSNIEVVNAVYGWSFGENSVLRVSGGYVGGPQNGVTWGVTAEHTFGALWTAAGYQRYVGFFGGLNPVTGPQSNEIPFAQSETPSSVYQVVSLRAKGHVWGPISVDASAQRARDTGNDFTGGLNSRLANGISSNLATIRVDYRLKHRFTIFARGDYYAQNINPFIASPFSERRISLGISVNLDRDYQPPDYRVHRTAPPDDRKEPANVLTEDDAKPAEDPNESPQ